MTDVDVLICGASIAGPTLAYWLHRHGFRVTVVERTPSGIGTSVPATGDGPEVFRWTCPRWCRT
jgi:2-polyprenyl-6-methoxyphenol hydroxylase-like FAD-dependent oxidoreductase